MNIYILWIVFGYKFEVFYRLNIVEFMIILVCRYKKFIKS